MVSLLDIFALYHWQWIVRELFYPYCVSLLGIIFGKQFQLIEAVTIETVSYIHNTLRDCNTLRHDWI